VLIQAPTGFGKSNPAIPMKRAFTLIELLVVIAIIAILAAILFPVFAQAKLAAKKTQGLAQAKQIGTAMQLYLGDADDVYFPYRTSDPNPTYTAMKAAGNPNADTYFGTSSRTKTFFNQLLYPYTKNDDMWKAPTQNQAWVNYDPVGVPNDNPAAFRSYGGQNSYGVNNYAFTAPGNANGTGVGGGLPSGSIAESSNTLIMVDASYYNVLPRYVAQLKGGPDATVFDVCGSTYPYYWRSLGNSNYFIPTKPTPAEAQTKIDQRYSGKLNVVRADTSAKSYDSKAVENDLRDKGANSMWDPYKQGYNTSCGID
jgi:prepilin-type N-terminal cleavage/methylation domain-containing protein